MVVSDRPFKTFSELFSGVFEYQCRTRGNTAQALFFFFFLNTVTKTLNIYTRFSPGINDTFSVYVLILQCLSNK